MTPASFTIPLFCLGAVAAAEPVVSDNPFATPIVLKPAGEAVTAPAAADSAPATPAAGRWQAGVRLRAGYDSNFRLLPSEFDPPAGESEGSVAGQLQGSLGYQHPLSPAWTVGGRLHAQADLYTESGDYDLAQIGGGANARWADRRTAVSLAAAHSVWLLDGDDAVTATGVSLGGSRILTDRWSGLILAEWQHLDYDERDDASGDLLALRAQPWFLPAGNDPQRRIEGELRVATYRADQDWASYTAVRPGLGGRWRLHPAALDRDLDLHGAVQVEIRSYDEAAPGAAEAEDAVLLQLDANAVLWLKSWLGVGAYAAFQQRASNLDDRDYDRIQTGVQFLGRW